MSDLKSRIAAKRAELKARSASFERAYKFKVGKTQLLVLPGVKLADDFSREYGAHYIKDLATDDVVAVVGDASLTYGQADPIREAIGELVIKANARGDEASVKKMKNWLARPVTVINAVVLAGDDENKGKVVRPEFSSNGFNDVLSKIEDAIEAGVITDMSKGFVLTVERVGTGPTDTRYSYGAGLKQPEKPLSQSILDQRIDLDDYVGGKFGASVATGLQHLSTLLGRDVTTSALGKAISETTKLVGSSSPAAAPAVTETTEDDLLALDSLGVSEDVKDAEFVESTVAPAAPVEPAKADEYDDILAELDNL